MEQNVYAYGKVNEPLWYCSPDCARFVGWQLINDIIPATFPEKGTFCARTSCGERIKFFNRQANTLDGGLDDTFCYLSSLRGDSDMSVKLREARDSGNVQGVKDALEEIENEAKYLAEAIDEYLACMEELEEEIENEKEEADEPEWDSCEAGDEEDEIWN